MVMVDASKIVFGDKVDNFVSTKVDAGVLFFNLGTVDDPLRAPFGVSEPVGGGTGGGRRTLDLERLISAATGCVLRAKQNSANMMIQHVKSPNNQPTT